MYSSSGREVTAIHVLGEAVADCIRSADGEVVTHAGGSAANVAYGLARLGRPVSLDTQLGADGHGALIRRHLVGSGVQLAESPLDGARTPSAVVVLDNTGAARYALDVHWQLAPGDLPRSATSGLLLAARAPSRPRSDDHGPVDRAGSQRPVDDV
jgi:fructokinase